MGRSVGLKVAHRVADTKQTQEYIESSNLNTIRLTFPNLDFGIAYSDLQRNAKFLREQWDQDVWKPFISESGCLVPHVRIKGFSSVSSLRELMAHLCLTEGKSYTFAVILSDSLTEQDAQSITSKHGDSLCWLDLSQGRRLDLSPYQKVEVVSDDLAMLQKYCYDHSKVLMFRGDGYSI